MPASPWNTLTVASDGLLANSNLGIIKASRGLLQLLTGSSGRVSREYYIRRDDEEILEIIISATLSGILK